MMLVGLIADTHGRLPSAAAELLGACDLILHAGDVGSPELLEELSGLAPVLAVLGNNDWAGDYPDVPYERRLDLDGVGLYMAHSPAEVERHLRLCSGREGAFVLPALCLHGHAHRPRDERLHGSRVICPGSPARPRGGSPKSLALLRIGGGRAESVEFHALF